MRYKELSIEKGQEFLPKIWTLIFKSLSEADFFVEPFQGRALRDCTQFRLGTADPDEVLCFVTGTHLLNLLTTPGELYLFGAYNQFEVCQMRALGAAVPVEPHPDINQIRESLRASIEQGIGSGGDKLSHEDVNERHRILDSGRPFRFRISSYAYSQYQRG